MEDYQQAIDFYEQGLAVTREIGDRQGEERALAGLGNAHFSLGQYEQAIDFYKQYLVITRELERETREEHTRVIGDALAGAISDRAGEGNALNNLGNAHQYLGRYEQAIDFYEQALVIFREIGNRSGEKSTLGNLGAAYDSLGQYQRAIDFHEESLVITREMGDRQGEGVALNNLGNAHQYLGQYEQAIGFYEQALVIFREMGDRAGERSAVSNLGAAHSSLGQYQQALDFREQELVIAREMGDLRGEGIELGNTYLNLGQYQQAINFYEQSLANARESGDRNGEAAALNNLGIAYDNLGQYQQALDFHEQSLAIAREAGNRQGEGTTLGNLGAVYLNLGRYQQAIDFHEQSLAIAREAGNRQGEGNALNNLGAVYLNLGQYQQAINFFEQVLVIFREIGDRQGEGIALGNLGIIYDRLGQYQQAIDFHERRLAIAREIGDRAGEGDALGNLGIAYRNMGQYQEAIALHERRLAIAREIGDRPGEGDALGNLGNAYRNMGQYQQALEGYQQSLAIKQEIGDRAGEGGTLGNMGDLLAEQNQPKLAMDYYQQSIAITESIQGEIQIEELKSSFASERIYTYSRLINLLGAQGDFTAAFNYAERAKARAFLDQIANGRIDFRAGVDSQLLQQEEDLNNQIADTLRQLIALRSQPQDQWNIETIAETDARLTALQQDYANLLIQIKLQSPATASLVTVDIAPLEEIQSLLEPDTTLVEYFVTSDRTFAFILTRDSFNTVLLDIRREDLVETITLLRDFSDLSDEIPPELQQLHQVLIEPLQPYLNSSRLIIVPHDILHYLPFAALTDGDRYLNDDYVISLLPSANTLQHLSEPHDLSQPTLLALGNPVISEPLSPLRYAEEEVEAIARLFNTQPLIGQTATEGAVRSAGGEASILHLAAHGEYDPINSLFSTLHLAADDQHDGRLEVREIYGLDLTQSTNLVVLSACQTTNGSLSRGDEIVGLNRAFLYAGTPAVMSSLWNVDDAATKRLMEEFYTHFKGGMSASEALQQAQQAVRAEYPNPYFWSAFSITGRSGQ